MLRKNILESKIKSIQIKVCGMRDAQNIEEVLTLKPDYLGLIFFPGSLRYMDDEKSASWNTISLQTKLTGVFVNAEAPFILERVNAYHLGAIQLHGQESPEQCARIRANLSEDICLIKAFGVSDQFKWSVCDDFKHVADYFLFDTHSASHGGTGKKFDWTLLSGYRGELPYFLSGGLGLEDVQEVRTLAEEDARLIAVDLNSRFELSPAVKNTALLDQTFKLLRNEV